MSVKWSSKALGALAILAIASPGASQKPHLRLIHDEQNREFVVVLGPFDLPGGMHHGPEAGAMVVPPVQNVELPISAYLHGFSYDAVEWVVERRPAILGSDMSAWQDPADDPGFFPMFLKSGTLLLAPMTNLTQIDAARIRLIVMPLAIHGTCASPCRVVGVLAAD